MLDAGRITGVVIYLFGGGLSPVRVVGLIVAETGATVGVVVARLGELMCDVVREFGKAFEPAAKVYCSPVFVTSILLGSCCFDLTSAILRLIRISGAGARRMCRDIFRWR